MKAEWSEKELRKAVQDVAKKAAADPKLRKLALKDPAAAIREVTGRSVPSGMKIDFIESGKGAVALKAKVQSTADTITDIELAKVSGGLFAYDPDEELAPVPKCGKKAKPGCPTKIKPLPCDPYKPSCRFATCTPRSK